MHGNEIGCATAGYAEMWFRGVDLVAGRFPPFNNNAGTARGVRSTLTRSRGCWFHWYTVTRSRFRHNNPRRSYWEGSRKRLALDPKGCKPEKLQT
jgi:hypothetical protein